MNLIAFLRRRFVQMIPVLFGISLITFFMIHLIPGDPARNMLGPRATPERVAELRQSLGLDEPLWSQYRRFLTGVVRGDLGTSLYYRQAVAPLVLERLPATVFLIVYSAVIALIVAIPLGMVAAMRRNTWIDQAIRTISLITLAMPAFWLGVLFILYFGLNLGWFPVGGYGETFREHLHHLFLPSLTIALAMAPILIRSLRSSMAGNLRAQFATTARAKGLTDLRVVTGHVLRPSLISTVTVLGVNLGFLIGSTVIVENVFSLPGAGVLLVQAISARDYPLVQSTTLVFAILVITVNLATDLVYSFLVPRVRLN